MKILVTEAQLDSMGSGVQESKVLCEQEKLLLGGRWLEKSSLMTCSMIYYCIDWLRLRRGAARTSAAHMVVVVASLLASSVMRASSVLVCVMLLMPQHCSAGLSS